MTVLFVARPLALAFLVALPLCACVSGPGNPSASRAAELAGLVSRADACRAGAPRATTLDRFIASEKARGATPEQLASARSTYVTVSEAQTINQGIRPQSCGAEERAVVRQGMAKVRAGDFSAF